MKVRSNFVLSGLMASLMFATSANAIETKARNAIIMDFDTGYYLFKKDHDKMVPPASMSKLMTIYMVFEKLKNGTLSLDDTFTVSENAWRRGGAATGGSTMFLKIGEKVRVEDLLKGIIIQSGNDACIVVAENLGGSEEDFANDMQMKARELGMMNSSFANATGLPHPDHRISVEDLAKLSRILIKEYPEYYHLFSQREFVHNGIRQGNRNPLLYSMSNADGLKTGHTEEAGFSLTASAKKDDRRLISVMTGLDSIKARSEEADKMMNWGFREFDNYKILKQGYKVASVPVWFGDKDTVDMIVSEDVLRTVKKNKLDKVKIVAEYDKPVKAPIKAGDKLGVAKIKISGQPEFEVPLVAEKSVNKIGFFGRVGKNLRYLLLGA